MVPTVGQLVDLHDRTLSVTGGAAGLRSREGLEAGFARVEMKQQYFPDSDVCSVAALLCASLIKAHCFTDGNKRAAYGAMRMTLTMNGMDLFVPVDEAVSIIVDVASGALTEEDLTHWLHEHAVTDPVYGGLFEYDLLGPEV